MIRNGVIYHSNLIKLLKIVISIKNIWFEKEIRIVLKREVLNYPDKKHFSPKSNPRWGKEEETEIFGQNVKLFRKGKISEDDFRRFRLQHGAYGSRLQQNYSMVRIKIPSGEITPEQLEKIATLSEAFNWLSPRFNSSEYSASLGTA